MSNSQSSFTGLRKVASRYRAVEFYHRPNSFFETKLNRTGNETDGNEIFTEQTGNLLQFIHPLNQRLERAFQYIDLLHDDWDSYGALAPTEDTKALVKRTASLFPGYLQPEIQPNPDGTIGLYWDGEGFSYGIEIGKAGKFQWFVEETDECEKIYGRENVLLEEVAQVFLAVFLKDTP